MPDRRYWHAVPRIVYRAWPITPKWAWTPLSGEGARRYGGRFNRRGVPALYSSLSPITAIREATPLGRPMQPLMLCAHEVDAKPVFDAADPTRLQERDVLEADLACPTWEADMLHGGVAASQRVAEVLVAAGYVGLLVRSFNRRATGSIGAPCRCPLPAWRCAYLVYRL